MATPFTGLFVLRFFSFPFSSSSSSSSFSSSLSLCLLSSLCLSFSSSSPSLSPSSFSSSLSSCSPSLSSCSPSSCSNIIFLRRGLEISFLFFTCNKFEAINSVKSYSSSFSFLSSCISFIETNTGT